MPGIRITIDPDAAPLELSEANGCALLSPLRQIPAPLEPQWASGIATEGELSAGGKRGNAQIIPRIRISGGTEALFRQAQIRLEQKVHKLQGEGGVLRIHLPDDSWIDWYVRAVEAHERLFDNRYIHRKRTEGEITFTCAPFGVGEEQEIAVTLEHAGPVLVTESFEVPGTAPALASALISAENDQWWLRPGIESRHLSDDLTAGCYYPATDLTPLGTATITSGVVRQGALTPTPQAMLSTLIAGVGDMTHVGVYELYAVLHMPTTNTGEVAVYLEWAAGNRLRSTSNLPVRFEANHSREGQDALVSLGEVRLRESGWEGRVVASSTVAGDDLDVKWIGLVPLAEGNATISGIPRLDAPTSVLIRDEFEQTAGPLDGKTIAVAGSASDPREPGTVVDDASIGTAAWVGADNIATGSTSDDPASAALGAGAVSHYLKATNFGFALPVGASVKGIAAEITRRVDPVGGVEGGHDHAVRIVKGGAIQASDRASTSQYTVDFADQSYGSVLDLWGATWTQTDINATGFGIAFAAEGRPSDALVVEVAKVRLIVYYDDSDGLAWTTTGDASDFEVEVIGNTAQRSAVSDDTTLAGRYAIAGTSALGAVVVGLDYQRGTPAKAASEVIVGGALARYIDPNNWLFGGFSADFSTDIPQDRLVVIKRVAGTAATIAEVPVPLAVAGAYRAIWLQVDAAGRFFLWTAPQGSRFATLALTGSDDVLAVSGALAIGKTGFYDAKTGSNPSNRNVDNYAAWQPPASGLLFAGLDVEWSHDRVRHQGPDGRWGAVPDHRTDFLLLPPSGVENRKTRIVALASRNDPAVASYPDPGALSIKSLRVTPRYLTVPDPA